MLDIIGKAKFGLVTCFGGSYKHENLKMYYLPCVGIASFLAVCVLYLVYIRICNNEKKCTGMG